MRIFIFIQLILAFAPLYAKANFIDYKKEISHLDSLLKTGEKKNSEKKNKETLKILLQSSELAKQQNDSTQLIKNYYLISQILRKTNNFEKALHYAQLAFNHNVLEKDTLLYLENTLRLTGAHFELYRKDSSKYKKHIQNVKSLSEKILKITGTSNNFDTHKKKAFLFFSTYHFCSKEYHLAEQYSLKTIEIDKRLKDSLGLVHSYNTLANNLTNINQYKKAENYYQKALDILLKIGNKKDNEHNKFRSFLYGNLAWAKYHLKDYKAYDYQLKHTKLNDSLRDSEFDAIINEIEAKHNVDIVKQNEEKKRLVEVQKRKRFQNWSIGLGLLAIILAISFWVFSLNAKLKRKNITLELNQSKLLKEKEIEKLRNESQIKILNATLDGKEVERKEIAETLHDSVSALLSAANLHLQASKRVIEGKIPEEINKTQNIIDEASVKVRDLSHNLISSVLLKFGLSYAIQDFCEKYSNSQLEIISNIPPLKRYDQAFEIKMNNIVEEFINNVIKHSNAEQAYVKIRETDGILNIQIFDDGDGFDTKKQRKSDGMGLSHIEARLKMMKGNLKIVSSTGEGTKIFVTVPIVNKTV